MDTLERIGLIGLVPVVVVQSAEDAVRTAGALLEGGLESMEITMRTDAGIEAIRAVKKAYPGMLVGAGTVLTLQKAEESVDAGAEFIVMPGFNEPLVRWCIDKGIPVVPGCVTPTEIDRALALGLTKLKFFPANIYGGIDGMKALHGPYRNVTFIPTGGANMDNLGEYASQGFIHAIGGSWLCAAKDINAGNFGRITDITRESIDRLLGFELAHVGINGSDEKTAGRNAEAFASAFSFPVKPGNSSIMAGSGIELVKQKGAGAMGHLAIRTNNIQRGIYYLEKRGFAMDPDSKKYKDGSMVAIFLKQEIGGFAVHLLQKA